MQVILSQIVFAQTCSTWNDAIISMTISCDKKSITLATTLDSNDENTAMNSPLKHEYVYHASLFTFLVFWMVMVWFYFPMDTVLVVDNEIMKMLGLCDEPFFRT